MAAMKTPGVYVVEKNAFPNSVVEVATAVPAFIGYTEKATNGNKSLLNKPFRITSMAEYHSYFGGAPSVGFTLAEVEDITTTAVDFISSGKSYSLSQTKGIFKLYFQMLMFFSNGGGPCYIVSVGNYNNDIDSDKLTNGIGELIREQEPTMVVIPETTLLENADISAGVHQAMLAHCNKMMSRIAILDIWGGDKDRKDPTGDPVLTFRDKVGTNFLDYGTSYYPWVNTTITQSKDLSFQCIENLDVLQKILTEELLPEGSTIADTQKADIEAKLKEITQDDLSIVDAKLLNSTLTTISPTFGSIIKSIQENLNIMSPSATIAGVYTMVDNSRGVWKAPANVSMNNVVSPSVNITHDDQEDLNVPLNGKAINAIRSFIGEGTLIWGARTLDGNSLDWRYINVRRTMIMLEESIKAASKAYVFEPNTANTWVTMKSMISSFLTGIWKRGGLAGSSPEEAFTVSIGLGATMTPNDILEGILRITVQVAISRPAEFIEITFQQQMQKS